MIYVGHGWVLSAAHVGLGDVVLGGVTYPALSGSRIVLIHSGTTEADLELFRIDPAPSLPSLPIRASEPAVDDPVIMIGNGRDRGDALSVFPPPSVDDGYYWDSSRAMRWGTNVVDSIEPDLDNGSRVTHSFATSFSRSGTVDECQAANGDSGGAVFIKNAGTWELAGVMHSIGVFAEQVDDLAETALYGNLTYAADLSKYRTQILDIVTPDLRKRLPHDRRGVRRRQHRPRRLLLAHLPVRVGRDRVPRLGRRLRHRRDLYWRER